MRARERGRKRETQIDRQKQITLLLTCWVSVKILGFKMFWISIVYLGFSLYLWSENNCPSCRNRNDLLLWEYRIFPHNKTYLQLWAQSWFSAFLVKEVGSKLLDYERQCWGLRVASGMKFPAHLHTWWSTDGVLSSQRWGSFLPAPTLCPPLPDHYPVPTTLTPIAVFSILRLPDMPTTCHLPRTPLLTLHFMSFKENISSARSKSQVTSKLFLMIGDLETWKSNIWFEIPTSIPVLLARGVSEKCLYI